MGEQERAVSEGEGEMKRGANMLTIAIIGAAGKMGSRISSNLSRRNYNLLLCEKGDVGITRLRERGFSNTETKRAVPLSDVIIMAVPDAKIGGISRDIVPIM